MVTNPPDSVRKRDGRVASFDDRKIYYALLRAGRATGEYGPDEATRMTEEVRDRCPAGSPDVETIQDLVEDTLLLHGYRRTARAYIVYREKRRLTREQGKVRVEVEEAITEYLDRRDWRVQANANQGYSLGGLILSVSGKMVANFWLNHVYPKEVGEAHRDGALHIHDLDMLSGYCAGWSLRTLLAEGLNGVANKVEASPPKHLSSAVGQIVNFLGTLQNEWAGAQAFSSFDTYLAPFIRKDRMRYEDVQGTVAMRLAHFFWVDMIQPEVRDHLAR